MGTLYVGARIENILDRDNGATIPRILVDTGSEYTWVAGATREKLGIKREKKDLAFVMANGQVITRSVGFAIVRVEKAFTVDEWFLPRKVTCSYWEREAWKDSISRSILARRN
jgi:predicted aspartyl protease